MFNIYKLSADGAVLGSALLKVPAGFTAYILGDEPQELLDALSLEASKSISDTLSMSKSKDKRTELNSIIVTTSTGVTFDGDDTGRESMLSAIEAASFLGLTEYNWKLADNEWALNSLGRLIQLTELREAHALAIQAKGVILAKY